MTLEEIKKNAPDGATHYREYNAGYIEYYIKIEGKWCYFKKEYDLYSTNLLDTDLKPL